MESSSSKGVESTGGLSDESLVQFGGAIEPIKGGVRFYVENIKCGGCASTISAKLKESGAFEVAVDPEAGVIEAKWPDLSLGGLFEAVEKLKASGYPLIQSADGFASIALKAKSFVSCGIGKLRG